MRDSRDALEEGDLAPHADLLAGVNAGAEIRAVKPDETQTAGAVVQRGFKAWPRPAWNVIDRHDFAARGLNLIRDELIDPQFGRLELIGAREVVEKFAKGRNAQGTESFARDGPIPGKDSTGIESDVPRRGTGILPVLAAR